MNRKKLTALLMVLILVLSCIPGNGPGKCGKDTEILRKRETGLKNRELKAGKGKHKGKTIGYALENG